MKNIYLIVGPSGSGKSSVAQELERRFGLKEVVSYTERPRRNPEEKGHIFVTPDEFDSLGRLCAFTLYNGYRYGVPESAVEQCDTYVIDPEGVRYMKEHYHGTKGVVVIGIWASEQTRILRMRKRGDSEEKIRERIACDRQAFEGLGSLCDVVFNGEIDLQKTVQRAYSYIVSREG